MVIEEFSSWNNKHWSGLWANPRNPPLNPHPSATKTNQMGGQLKKVSGWRAPRKTNNQIVFFVRSWNENNNTSTHSVSILSGFVDSSLRRGGGGDGIQVKAKSTVQCKQTQETIKINSGIFIFWGCTYCILLLAWLHTACNHWYGKISQLNKNIQGLFLPSRPTNPYSIPSKDTHVYTIWADDG